MGRLLTVSVCVVTMLLLTVWKTEQVSVGPNVVQLVGGTSDKEGLVQVVYGSQVGTVCVPDTYNRNNTARVVCRQLGYVLGEYGKFPRGAGTVSILDVKCDGYERSVFMCRSGRLFVPPSDRCANHDFDLGVRCSDGMRLLYTIHNTNNSITGVVQINRGSGWINICNDFFDDLDAQVVCLSQGYSYSRVLPKGSMAYLSGNNLITALNCNGTEASLLDCPEQQNIYCPWGNSERYATVFCSQTPSERGLQAAPTSVGGPVVVMADGVKSYVCRDNWDDAAASVYCKDLGYNNGVAIYQTEVSISRDVAAYLVNSIHCTGNENSLSECSFSSNWSTCVTGYSSAAQALCYNYASGRELRLTGGTTSNVGQVEVGFNGVWGTVCDNVFTNYDATAVCLTLGYFGGLTLDSSGSVQNSTGPFYLYGLSCRGSENSLWQCPIRNFNVSYSFCSSPSYIPRVRCTGQVKLVENEGYGAVQVPINTTSRTYGLVCDDNFTDREASVVCRDLGYPYGIHLCCSVFGYKSLPIVRSGVRCTGSEALFNDCYYDTRTYCLSGKYASIVCSNIPPGSGYTVQIDTVSRGSYGRVKVQHMGYWGFVCPSGFDHNDANVICREVGYTGGWAVVDKSYDSSSLRWLSNIDCDGSESHLSLCRNLVFGNVSNCGKTGIAAAYCNREADTQFRLVNGTQTTGRLEVSMDYGNSGLICSEGWTDVEAAVACKSMGFRSGRFLGAGIYGKGPSYLLLNHVDCTRATSSQSLLDCDLSLSSPGYRYTSCSYSSYGPAVQCFNDSVRLTGTRQENYGRVEVYTNDTWTAVCDQGFDQTAAQVACRALGLLYARPQCCSALGPLGTGPVDARQIGFKVNRCRGDEATLADCDVSTSVVCPSGKYASVLCSNTSLQEQTLTVRLAGPGGYYGMVEVNRYGLWGPVCNNSWDDRDANATCRGLGYSHGVTFYGSNVSETPILVGDFQCSGQESSLGGCSFKDSIGCSKRQVAAGVLCSRTSDIKLRLTDGGRNYGRLEVMYEGQWGRVISSGYFSDTNAEVACRHLGFMGGQTAPEYMRRGHVMGRILMSGIYCKGYEQSLFECSNSWNSSSGRGWDVYVFCYNTTRLSSGNSVSSGVVQIYYNKHWGAICDGGWSEEDTAVACRDLGYDNGYYLCCSPFGKYSTPIAENFQCTGREQTLTNCSHSPPESLNYCTRDVVSVACYKGPAPTGYTFSLDGGSTYNSGEVQVTFMGITGRICSDNWDDTDARVYCRELGFLAGQAFKHHVSTHLFWMTDVQCTGSERFLRDCPKTLAAVSQCSTKLSAGVTCSDIEGINYRLAGSNSSYKGRVEVQINGTWGSVCGYDNGYYEYLAKVVCRMYGFTEGSIGYLESYPDPPNKRYQNTFTCKGDEAVLDDCPHSGWRIGDNYCTPAGVNAVCYGDVRIGTRNFRNARQGPVQFYRNGTWYNLCDTGFDDITARRVCQDMEYVDGRAVCCSAYGTALDIMTRYETNLDYTMRCQGTESDSTDCLRPGGCLSGNYASVVCFNSTDVVDEGYRFDFQDNTKTGGQVVVTHLGVAGRICNTFWDDADARVLCRSRGHQDGAAYQYLQDIDEVYRLFSERGPYWISDVNCTGSEASLGDCPFNDRLHLGNCSMADLAGAVCFNDTGIQYRLVGGDRQGAGRVEISVGGLWGTVCGTDWDDKDASVLCRTLNYTDGYAVGDAYYGQGAGPIWLSIVQCKGSERSLAKCPHSGFNDEFVFWRCRSHTNVASVICIDKIKLNLGFNASMGAVMVYLGDAWTLICDEDFNANSAVTACRSLGFPHGLHVRGGVFGRVDAPIGITHVRCTGRELSLLDCTYNVTTSCSSMSYASVVCSREPFVETGAKVRIVEDTLGEPHHGLIDVQMERVWGAVCAAGFGVTEATVACKELGFAGGVPYTAHLPDRNRKPILMSDVKCRGDEKSLFNCQHTTTSTTSWCDYYAPRASVLCYNDTNGISYRLVGDTDPSRGRVEMQYGGVWGSVCVQDVVSRAGGPACRSLGYGEVWSCPHTGQPYSSFLFEDPSSNLFWFYQLNCQGNESSLPLCTSTGFNNSIQYYYKISCSSYRTLHVQCFSKDTVITNLRLAGSTTNSSGRVEVFLQGPDQWGTVCDSYWDDFDATVVCNQLGYATGKRAKIGAFGEGQGRIWLDKVGCLGTETRLQDCAFIGFGDSYFCRHSIDAGVICSGVFCPPTSVTYTVTSIVTYTTVDCESPETSSVHDSTQSQLTPTHSGSYTAAIVVPVFIVAIVIAITVGAIIYGRKVERLVAEGETRPGLMSLEQVASSVKCATSSKGRTVEGM
ncbi:scavenger receptor cysteine-rich type 1 protein M160-like [Pomacea canaliculata]|uniref:scavenger receptor cysteine-rich type 1 protein M160-like n=1 Tax=Pomacea canaliculata TaxID=400727 RepID=UPI000D73B8F2|nr:scavenger receptor cysteine-rich type 1 protein M160-like [Pomacea canaliculata]